MQYPFPGNVRELKAVIELAMVMADDDIIQEDDINFSSTKTMADFLAQEKNPGRLYPRNHAAFY